MVTVVLAEKPTQALEYAKALGILSRNNGYFEVKNDILKDQVYVTFAIGHLIELEQPSFYDEKWKVWSVNNLPIFPKNLSFKISEKTKDQFKVVSGLLKKADRIIIATDSDREGENSATCF